VLDNHQFLGVTANSIEEILSSGMSHNWSQNQEILPFSYQLYFFETEYYIIIVMSRDNNVEIVECGWWNEMKKLLRELSQGRIRWGGVLGSGDTAIVDPQR
jgi:hypothetical protein